MKRTVAILVFVLAAGTAFAGRPAEKEQFQTSRAEVVVLAKPEAPGAAPESISRTVTDLRDSAALILVGSMLLGLAAAVRRDEFTVIFELACGST